jgi:hypothetical protein
LGGLKLQSLRDFLERRQLLERAQPEVVEELSGGGVQRRAAGRLAVADHVDPAARLERLDDLRRHHDPAHVLDVASGDRLAVGDDGERLHHRARVARRLLGEQALDVGPELGPRLEAPAARELRQLHGAPAPLLAQLAEQRLEHLGAQLFVEQPLQVRDAERLRRGQERSFEDALGFSRAVHGPILRKSARNIRTA